MAEEQSTGVVAGVVLIFAVAVAVIYYFFFGSGSVEAAGTDSGVSDSGADSNATASVVAFADAIAQQENVDPSYNNPGALAAGDVGSGTFGADLTIYPTSTAGWNALYSQLNVIINGTSTYYTLDETFYSMGTTWANGDPNWGPNVAGFLGVDPSSAIGDSLDPGWDS